MRPEHMTMEEVIEYNDAHRKPRNKYGNKRVQYGDLTFDSKAELARWQKLLLLQELGLISDLERQVEYVLVPAVRMGPQQRLKPATKLIVDFRYTEGGKTVLEDTKGVITDVFRLKVHLLKDRYGMEVRLSK